MVEEAQLLNSFRLVKNDILNIQEEIFKLSHQQSEILKKLEILDVEEVRLAQKLEKRPRTKTKIITKTVVKPKRKTYISAKTGKDFHVDTCALAKNIKPRNKVTFKSKKTALNQGYRACTCVN